MHDDQLLIDVDVAGSLIRDQFPAWAAEPVERVASNGTVNAVFRIGTDLVARFPLRYTAPDTAADALSAEAAAMTELARYCPFPTPQPIATGRPETSYPMPWSIQTWVPGDIATPGGLASSTTFVNDLADLIGTLRSAPTHGRRFTGDGRGGHLSDHDDWMDLCCANASARTTHNGREGPRGPSNRRWD